MVKMYKKIFGVACFNQKSGVEVTVQVDQAFSPCCDLLYDGPDVRLFRSPAAEQSGDADRHSGSCITSLGGLLTFRSTSSAPQPEVFLQVQFCWSGCHCLPSLSGVHTADERRHRGADLPWDAVPYGVWRLHLFRSAAAHRHPLCLPVPA